MKVPSSAFAQPNQNDIELNQDYWDSYRLAQTVEPPSPEKSKDYWSYRTLVNLFLKPVLFGNPSAAGWNCAVIDGANWVYVNDPTSPHNRVV
jgi:hypothetical protein